MTLHEYHGLPHGLLEKSAQQLHLVLPGPSLIHLEGRRSPGLFISILLHGNEDTGWEAVRRVLEHSREHGLARSLTLFIGNIEAARVGQRHLDGQPDYNRIWPGTLDTESPESRIASQVVDLMAAQGVFASLDIHNNTGLNPHYACINRLHQPFLHLATLFSRTVVYFTRPVGVQSAAFAGICPAVTLECGKPGVASGVEHAATFIEACLNLADFPEHPVPATDLDLYHTVATVKVPEACSIGFADAAADINFIPELDHFNFRELEPGTLLASVNNGFELLALDEAGQNAGQHYFDYQNGGLRMKRRLMPAMLTRDTRVIRQDCLCYLMERLPYPG